MTEEKVFRLWKGAKILLPALILAGMSGSALLPFSKLLTLSHFLEILGMAAIAAILSLLGAYKLLGWKEAFVDGVTFFQTWSMWTVRAILLTVLGWILFYPFRSLYYSLLFG